MALSSCRPSRRLRKLTANGVPADGADTDATSDTDSAGAVAPSAGTRSLQQRWPGGQVPLEWQHPRVRRHPGHRPQSQLGRAGAYPSYRHDPIRTAEGVHGAVLTRGGQRDGCAVGARTSVAVTKWSSPWQHASGVPVREGFTPGTAPEVIQLVYPAFQDVGEAFAASGSFGFAAGGRQACSAS